MSERRYADPAALRQAINARLRALVGKDPQLQLTDLQRQFAYDRFLTRVFLAPDRERWVLKGAAALLARLHARARHTLDLDLYREDSGLDEAEAALRAAAGLDMGDFFRFTLSPGGRSPRRASSGEFLSLPIWAPPSSPASTLMSLSG